ncbi:DNA helicase RecQ [Lutibaculum baratangense]|uniref:DNA helicase RecQ n=1 Tax=Lutibaculum baratangense AMV1 TaxID=631454 RepID=V4RMN6_9HYPH|nr:DNA helicase RecQ [Lutibaculum baratangense]ESR26539.1 ATP-dependent DNA helicase RecQ [Lutibaculum baratangense AMV1]
MLQDASPEITDAEAAASGRRKLDVLRQTFGFDSFRSGQEEIVDSVLAGQNTLAIMPTGAGKSLCYQLPALVLGGLTIVVSPLIALMEDQVAALTVAGLAAGAIHSGKSRDENVAVWRRVAAGEIRLIYMSPERLLSDRMIAALQRLPVRLIAVDEAHCVSQWGHSFRSDYLGLSILRERFPGIGILALTATADTTTREEIRNKLFGAEARVFVSGFDRPNIQLTVVEKDDTSRQIERFIDERPGVSGIVYRLSRKKVEQTAERLAAKGVRALPYHAGMSQEDRARNQETFLAEAGVVMVATIAFGMGIDKSDVRYVLHGDLPSSLEAYYQEIGRAGRDGAAAEAHLLYGLEDVQLRRRFIDEQETDEARKAVEARRLDALLGFCEASTCRRSVLLRYFGEEQEPCGNCDVCLDPPQLVDGTEPARLALAAVSETGERFGAAHVVSVLIGRQTDKIRERGHDTLTVYGAGAARPANEWRSILRQMVTGGLLHLDHGAFGSVTMTREGRLLAEGQGRFDMRPVRKPAKKPRGEAAQLPPEDAELMGRLKKLRRELAAERGVPAYVIFSDRTLAELARHRPGSLTELAEIHGVGRAKLEQFGQPFLQLLAD